MVRMSVPVVQVPSAAGDGQFVLFGLGLLHFPRNNSNKKFDSEFMNAESKQDHYGSKDRISVALNNIEQQRIEMSHNRHALPCW